MNLILIIVLVVLIVVMLGSWLYSCASVGTKKGSDGAVTITVVVGILVVVLSILIQLGVPERLFGTAGPGTLSPALPPDSGQAPAVAVTAPPSNDMQQNVGQPDNHGTINNGGGNPNTHAAGQTNQGGVGDTGAGPASRGNGDAANGAPGEVAPNQD